MGIEKTFNQEAEKEMIITDPPDDRLMLNVSFTQPFWGSALQSSAAIRNGNFTALAFDTKDGSYSEVPLVIGSNVEENFQYRTSGAALGQGINLEAQYRPNIRLDHTLGLNVSHTFSSTSPIRINHETGTQTSTNVGLSFHFRDPDHSLSPDIAAGVNTTFNRHSFDVSALQEDFSFNITAITASPYFSAKIEPLKNLSIEAETGLTLQRDTRKVQQTVTENTEPFSHQRAHEIDMHIEPTINPYAVISGEYVFKTNGGWEPYIYLQGRFTDNTGQHNIKEATKSSPDLDNPDAPTGGTSREESFEVKGIQNTVSGGIGIRMKF